MQLGLGAWHEVKGGDADHRFTAYCEIFVIFTETPIPTEPSKGILTTHRRGNTHGLRNEIGKLSRNRQRSWFSFNQVRFCPLFLLSLRECAVSTSGTEGHLTVSTQLSSSAFQ